MERLSSISDLIGNINKAHSKEDLKSSLEIQSQFFNLDRGSTIVELKTMKHMRIKLFKVI